MSHQIRCPCIELLVYETMPRLQLRGDLRYIDGPSTICAEKAYQQIESDTHILLRHSFLLSLSSGTTLKSASRHQDEVRAHQGISSDSFSTGCFLLTGNCDQLHLWLLICVLETMITTTQRGVASRFAPFLSTLPLLLVPIYTSHRASANTAISHNCFWRNLTAGLAFMSSANYSPDQTLYFTSPSSRVSRPCLRIFSC
jgi:hypothetical protein